MSALKASYRENSSDSSTSRQRMSVTRDTISSNGYTLLPSPNTSEKSSTSFRRSSTVLSRWIQTVCKRWVILACATCSLLIILVFASKGPVRDNLPAWLKTPPNSDEGIFSILPISASRTPPSWPEKHRPASSHRQGEAPDDMSIALANAVFPLPIFENYVEIPYHTERRKVLTELIHCHLHNICTAAQKSVVLIGAGRFLWAFDDTFDKPASFANGEAILGKSFIWGLEQLEVPYIFVEMGADGSAGMLQSLARIHAILTTSVRAVVLDYLSEPECLAMERCVESKTFASGIPPWKIFVWDGLGGLMEYEKEYRWPWHLVGQPMGVNSTYLGVTVEPDCKGLSFTPMQQRKNTAFIFGKERHYFSSQRAAWNETDYNALEKETGLVLTVGTQPVTEWDDTPLPKVLSNLGTFSRTEFIETLGSARVVIGQGNPTESPTPFEAMCMGTPVVMPYVPVGVPEDFEFDGKREHFWAQHSQLMIEKPPHVYNVRAHDAHALIKAVKDALARPPKGPYIPPALTGNAYVERVREFLDTDWHALHSIAMRTLA
ncbi:uncharacterized protein L969DRAFT_93048 [Mixia osmundae IAM 14324]|uniref:alpha-1,6-mannosyl-glycoprotein 6-beta-N-acetylglucosaminyltransferase n=1 Tax=Mixia osmundae (strain CBS 9802 / IAM 14324 / JCM 22182 / KY 12970) TaxID=764103 RepID=G7E694_MIXOS|nr:uncharacterized protein L969DRAFT_93048 [Mixia osmundae IAM 14324]KEI40491.1 hypothetical protein L969DRAFT_93048 [Mixia osmundae IAM 14324]GAA98354.1 hypothetical protein E5Q_05040 [Mixia osmundae IAM 14324]